jgi:hypothetical protein
MITSSPPPERVLFRARVERPRGGETVGRNPTQERTAAAVALPVRAGIFSRAEQHLLRPGFEEIR